MVVDKTRVIIVNRQKEVKIPTGIRMLIRRCCNAVLKLEKFNPGGSMKDRMALNMIEQAEKDGRLKPGGTIIESSSGNTAIGLAIASAIKGYKFIAVVDHHASKEKLI